MMQPSLLFRPLQQSDFSLLQEWLAAPHVAAWWNEPNDLASVKAKYSPRINGTEPTHVFVIEWRDKPIGWIQWYLWADYPEHAVQLRAEPAWAGIDLAIGQASLTGLGLGPIIIREFLDRIVFVDLAIKAVVTDPETSNARSLQAFRSAGFRPIETVRLINEKCSRYVMHRERP